MVLLNVLRLVVVTNVTGSHRIDKIAILSCLCTVLEAVDRWLRGGGEATAPAPALLAWPSRLSHALRNACIIIMTDADRAAAPLICRAFDLAAADWSRRPYINEPARYLYSIRRRV
ncbi:unnamed protein product [Pieris macdunnoughi]|uniref:Uncharacterized protein n=1 Tax=Pieris macdunnoughi TaxID=345717 RepID=A0A821P6R9_9NEOP|nr:unnamed protein product [Pieris macdunnoughi]